MDSTVIENEVIYALHFDPMPSNSDSVEVKISFLHMYQLKHQDADGVHDAISVNVKESISKGFKSTCTEGIDTSKKMIGLHQMEPQLIEEISIVLKQFLEKSQNGLFLSGALLIVWNSLCQMPLKTQYLKTSMKCCCEFIICIKKLRKN